MKKYSLGYNKIVGYLMMMIISIIFIRAIGNFVNSSSQDDTIAIEESINSALMQCYALEGAYPSDIYYLQEYGVWFNEETYYYDYDYLDGGIMPTVSVVSKADKRVLGVDEQEAKEIFSH